MKTIYKTTFSLLIAIFFTSVLGYSNNIDRGKFKKTRTVKKVFQVDKDNTLNIDNKYGDLRITTWEKNSIDIEVIITVSSNNEEVAEKKFKAISIDFRKDNNTVYAETIISKTKSMWSFFSGSSSVNTRIDYIVKMPVSNNVDLENDYGSIFIDKLDGESKINCDYGGINIGELNNVSNSINMDYAHSSSIDFVNIADINTDYSKLAIEKANKILLNADYTNIEVNDVEEIAYNNDYGSLKVASAQKIQGNGDYLTVKVYELNTSFDVSADYGSIKIYKLYDNFNQVRINGEYTGIKIGVASDADFNFEASTSYAGISFEDLDVDYSFKEDKMSSKSYKGNVNGANSNSNLKITSSYGSIKIFSTEQ